MSRQKKDYLPDGCQPDGRQSRNQSEHCDTLSLATCSNPTTQQESRSTGCTYPIRIDGAGAAAGAGQDTHHVRIAAGLEVAPLGNYYRLSHPPQEAGNSERESGPPEAGEAAFLVKIPVYASQPPKSTTKNAPNKARLERYRLLEIARNLLPGSRVATCLRKVGFDPKSRKQHDCVEARQSAKDGHRYTGNVVPCNRAWACPNCHYIKSCAYLGRMLDAFERPDNKKRFVYGMETLTAGHKATMSPTEIINRVKDAKKRFFSGRWAKAFKDRWHIRGRFVAHDITVGDNGCHIHFHIMLVADKGGFEVLLMDGSVLWVGNNLNERVIAEMYSEAAYRWQECCEKAGLYASLEHGYHIQGADKNAAQYLAKLAMEVTLMSSKKSHQDGMTLLQLLDAAGQGNEWAGQTWQEIVKALKGARIIRPSNGLWKLLGEDEPTESELVDTTEDQADLVLARLAKAEWYELLRQGKVHEWRQNLDAGIDELVAWCQSNGFGLELAGGEDDDQP